MDSTLAQRLACLRQSEHFAALKDYLLRQIEAARDSMEAGHSIKSFWKPRGELAAFRAILKDFEQLDLFVPNRDNSSANPG